MKAKSLLFLIGLVVAIGVGFVSMTTSTKKGGAEGSAAELVVAEGQPTNSGKIGVGQVNEGVDLWMGKGWGSDAYQFGNYQPLEFKESEDREAALTIPDEILKTMSTQGLIRSIVGRSDFSMLLGLMNTPELAVKGLREYNSIQELLRRDDAAKYLIQLYRKIDVSKQPGNVTSRHYALIEVLFMQPELMNMMTQGERQQVLLLLKQNNKIKEQSQQLYSWTNHSMMLWSMCGLITHDNPNFINQFPNMTSYLKSGVDSELGDTQAIQAVYDYVMNYSYGQ